jgi:hypothetical protein
MVSVTSQWAQLCPTRMNTYYAFGGACYIIIQQIIKKLVLLIVIFENPMYRSLVKCLVGELYCLILFKETGETKQIGKPSLQAFETYLKTKIPAIGNKIQLAPVKSK